MAENLADATTLDLHHLTASCRAPCPDGSAALTKQATQATQMLVDGLFALPVDRSPAGPIARLPAGVTPLPREKRLPEARPETKWEAFAKEKGIGKKKTSRMAWDEDRDKWAPQWGYDRAGGGDAPIIELKGDDIMSDPREATRKAKKARVDKNASQRAGNEKRAKKAKGKDSRDKIPEGLPTDLAEGPGRRHKGADGVAGALKRAQVATASLGKFDALVHGEKSRPKVEDRARGRKRAFLAVAGAKGADEKRALGLMEDLQRPRASRPARGAAEVQDTHDFEAPNVGKKRKKGKAGGGKATKITKARAK